MRTDLLKLQAEITSRYPYMVKVATEALCPWCLWGSKLVKDRGCHFNLLPVSSKGAICGYYEADGKPGSQRATRMAEISDLLGDVAIN